MRNINGWVIAGFNSIGCQDNVLDSFVDEVVEMASQLVALSVLLWSWVSSASGVARRLVLVDGSKGVAEPSWRRPKFCRRPGVFAHVSILVACSGP